VTAGLPEPATWLFDQAGNIYGTTVSGGSFEGVNCASGGCGAVFELTPSNGGWTESVLYSFTDGSDGSYPWSVVIFDRAGNLYGAASRGGPNYGGTVYQLQPSGSGWAFNTIYGLGNDADSPYGDLILDSSGNLYGTSGFGGPNDAGTAFKLGLSDGVWTYTSLHDFTDNSNGGSDGAEPVTSLVFDANGNLYGNTRQGGSSG